jgi:hypothetical protein
VGQAVRVLTVLMQVSQSFEGVGLQMV